MMRWSEDAPRDSDMAAGTSIIYGLERLIRMIILRLSSDAARRSCS